jgi:5-methylcytosine-specific restriction endonuclease McrA
MPYMTNGKRDYKKENAKYNSRPEVIKKRVERNAARQQLMKEGLVRKGDGKDVDHKVPLSKGGSTSRSNLRVVPRSSNTSFSRNKDGSLKSQTSKRESGRGKKR